MMQLQDIMAVAVIMAVANIAIAMLVLLRRISVSWQCRRLEAAKSKITPLVNRLVAADDPADARSQLLGARGVRRAVIAQVAAEYASRIAGPRKERITDLFEDAGYLDWLHRETRRRFDWRAARACAVLGKIGSERSIDVVARCLDRRDLELRSEAAQALGRIGLPACAPHLVRALNTAGPDEALGPLFHAVMELGAPGTAAYLASLGSIDPRLRHIACLGLSRIDPHLAHAHALTERLAVVAVEDSVQSVRVAALRALGDIGDAAGAEAVAHGLAADSLPEQTAAATAARSFPTAAVLPGLLEAVRSDDRMLALAAGESLVVLLDHPDMRREVADSLRGRYLTWSVRRAQLERQVRAG